MEDGSGGGTGPIEAKKSNWFLKIELVG